MLCQILISTTEAFSTDQKMMVKMIHSRSLLFSFTNKHPDGIIITDIFSLFSIFSFKLTHYNLHDDLIGAKKCGSSLPCAREHLTTFSSSTKVFVHQFIFNRFFLSLSLSLFHIFLSLWVFLGVCVRGYGDAVNCNQM